ncbi:MAG: purine-binding chemotaxis protein CheW [Campylobacterota bacterium]|nr:purine-binding chemotaxis protein CheW [Campylobacterota bacterium]
MNLDKDIQFEENFGSVENQYLLFLSGGDLYAIEALSIKEIVEYGEVTKVPMMCSFVKGVTNIRGNIVPVIDLLDRLSLGCTRIQNKTSIIVINLKGLEKDMQIGVVVDEIFEVDNISIIDTREAPEFGSKIKKRFIKKMGKYSSEYIPILDINNLLDIEELSKIPD